MFKKGYLILIPIAALLVAAAFFIPQSDNPINQNANKEIGITAEFTGKISGLPPEINDPSSVAIFKIVDPTAAFLIAGKEVEGELSSYKMETTSGWRMIILNVWNFDSKKAYIGASRAFNISAGEKREADIVLKETGVFNDISATRVKPTILDGFNPFPKSLLAYAVEDKPVLAVVGEKGQNYSFHRETIELELASSGYWVMLIDEERLGYIEEERNLKGLAPDAYGDFMPLEPNFLVKLDVQFKVNWPVVTISLINAENQEVIWKETTDSRVETKAYDLSNAVEFAADKLVESVSGKGANPVQFPKFTPSIPKPVKSPLEWGAKMRKLLGLDKQSESKPQSPPTPTTNPSPTLSCDFNGFVSCRDKFNLQGCINACPLVNKSCPEGTPPDTECKQTDEECSNKCWDQGTSHGSQCAAANKCSMQEVEERLRAQ